VSRNIVMFVSDGSMDGTQTASAAKLGTRAVHPDQFLNLLDQLQRARPKAPMQPAGDPASTPPVHKMTVDNTPPPSRISGYS
jgi:hypothetical protein